jgi:hypothetical protein
VAAPDVRAAVALAAAGRIVVAFAIGVGVSAGFAVPIAGSPPVRNAATATIATTVATNSMFRILSLFPKAQRPFQAARTAERLDTSSAQPLQSYFRRSSVGSTAILVRIWRGSSAR